MYTHAHIWINESVYVLICNVYVYVYITKLCVTLGCDELSKISTESQNTTDALDLIQYLSQNENDEQEMGWCFFLLNQQDEILLDESLWNYSLILELRWAPYSKEKTCCGVLYLSCRAPVCPLPALSRWWWSSVPSSWAHSPGRSFDFSCSAGSHMVRGRSPTCGRQLSCQQKTS